MQQRLSLLLFCISIFLLYQSLSALILPQAEQLTPGGSQIIEELPAAQMEYSALELGCNSKAATPSSLYAKAYCLLDADSGRVLCGKEENAQLPMASTTKIMTCILALESGKLDDIVTVSSYAATMPDVQLNIRKGEQYRLEDLLYSLMLESHNDTAVAIAEHLGGSVEGFAEMMNEKAAVLNCSNTHFVTPNGLDSPEHYTTAKELCQIASYAIRNKKFLKIIQTPSHSFREISGKRSFTVHNHDAFLGLYSGAIGVKTGFTGKAGYCFCGAVKQGDKTLVSAVLASGWPPHKTYKWADTKKLMDYGFKGYDKKEIPILNGNITLPVENGQKDTLSIKRSPSEAVTLPLTSSDQITYSRELPQQLEAPVRAGDIVGYESYSINGECFLQIELTATQDVPEVSYPFWFSRLVQLFFAF